MVHNFRHFHLNVTYLMIVKVMMICFCKITNHYWSTNDVSCLLDRQCEVGKIGQVRLQLGLVGSVLALATLISTWVIPHTFTPQFTAATAATQHHRVLLIPVLTAEQGPAVINLTLVKTKIVPGSSFTNRVHRIWLFIGLLFSAATRSSAPQPVRQQSCASHRSSHAACYCHSDDRLLIVRSSVADHSLCKKTTNFTIKSKIFANLTFNQPLPVQM